MILRHGSAASQDAGVVTRTSNIIVAETLPVPVSPPGFLLITKALLNPVPLSYAEILLAYLNIAQFAATPMLCLLSHAVANFTAAV